jgi:hypothetical protein
MSPSKSGGRLLKLFMKSDRKKSSEVIEKEVSDKIRSAPSSPSTLRRFFRRPSLQTSSNAMSKSRSETSLNSGREKSPKLAEEICPKKPQLKRSKSLNDGRSNSPKVVKSTNPFENDDDVDKADDSDHVYQTISCDKVSVMLPEEKDRQTDESRICEKSDNRCFDCHLLQNGGGNRIVSVYENLDDEDPDKTPTREIPIRCPLHEFAISAEKFSDKCLLQNY